MQDMWQILVLISWTSTYYALGPFWMPFPTVRLYDGHQGSLIPLRSASQYRLEWKNYAHINIMPFLATQRANIGSRELLINSRFICIHYADDTCSFLRRKHWRRRFLARIREASMTQERKRTRKCPVQVNRHSAISLACLSVFCCRRFETEGLVPPPLILPSGVLSSYLPWCCQVSISSNLPYIPTAGDVHWQLKQKHLSCTFLPQAVPHSLLLITSLPLPPSLVLLCLGQVCLLLLHEILLLWYIDCMFSFVCEFSGIILYWKEHCTYWKDYLKDYIPSSLLSTIESHGKRLVWLRSRLIWYYFRYQYLHDLWSEIFRWHQETSHLKAGPIQFLSCNKSLFIGLFDALSESITSPYSMVFDCFLARFGRQKLFFVQKP